MTGCVFELEGGKIMLEDGWREGPVVDAGARWNPADVGGAVEKLLAERVAPTKGVGDVMGASNNFLPIQRLGRI